MLIRWEECNNDRCSGGIRRKSCSNQPRSKHKKLCKERMQVCVDVLKTIFSYSILVSKGLVMQKQVKINDKIEQCFGVVMMPFSSSK